MSNILGSHTFKNSVMDINNNDEGYFHFEFR